MSIKPYTAVGLIPTVRGIRHRSDIKHNLTHIKHLTKAASWLSSLDIPVKLIAVPEGALQGFNDEVLDLFALISHSNIVEESAFKTEISKGDGTKCLLNTLRFIFVSFSKLCMSIYDLCLDTNVLLVIFDAICRMDSDVDLVFTFFSDVSQRESVRGDEAKTMRFELESKYVIQLPRNAHEAHCIS